MKNKMTNKMKMKVLAVLVVACSLLSCKMPYDPPANVTDNPIVAELDTLFEAQVDGSYVFLTNSSEYWSENGYTLWTISGDESAAAGTFTTFEATASKISGNAYAGYGIVFCHGTNDDGESAMYTAMINTKGQYAVGKVIDGTYTSLKWWQASSALNTGWGGVNTITATLDTTSGEYVIALNGEEAFRFAGDDTVTPLAVNGFVVVISPYDSFPSTSVEVHFE